MCDKLECALLGKRDGDIGGIRMAKMKWKILKSGGNNVAKKKRARLIV